MADDDDKISEMRPGIRQEPVRGQGGYPTSEDFNNAVFTILAHVLTVSPGGMVINVPEVRVSGVSYGDWEIVVKRPGTIVEGK